MTDEFVEFVLRITEGKLLPREHDAVWVAAMLTVLVPDAAPDDMNQILAGHWDKLRSNFAMRLVEALDCIRREQESRWMN